MAVTQTVYGHFTDPRVITVSRSARWLDHEAKGWCNEHRTDGKLPAAMLRYITDSDDAAAEAAELVASGAWEPTPEGWQLDWSHQETKTQAEDRQKAHRKRQADYMERIKLHAAGDHRKCIPRYCKAVRTDSVSDSSVTASVTPFPSPSQSSPVLKGKDGLGKGAARTASTASAEAPAAPAPAPAGEEEDPFAAPVFQVFGLDGKQMNWKATNP